MGMKRGDKGSQVRKLQNALIQCGYSLPRWGVDGDLGSETLDAANLLLLEHGDGVADDTPEEISDAELKFIFDLANSKAVKLPVAKELFHDRRTTSSREHIQRKRNWRDVKGICLHQTACLLGERPARWDTVGCHVGVTRGGKVIWLHDFTWNVAHGNLWNTNTVGIEFDGQYEGILGNLKTLWDNPQTKEREKPHVITPALVTAGKGVIRWICEETARHGGCIEYICAHRQSSAMRQSDPGSGLWGQIAVPMLDELGLEVGKKGKAIGTGRPIPEAWDARRFRGVKY